MWQMDIIRHAARGEVSAILGEGTDDVYLNYDIGWRTENYSEAERQKIFDDLDNKYGAAGAQVQAGLEAYTDGINKYIADVRAGTIGQPPEYIFRQVELEDWQITDSIAIGVLQLRDFGETAGTELRNAALLQDLKKRLGAEVGEGVFRDLVWTNDPESPVTVPAASGAFPSQDLGPVNPKAVAIPDNATELFGKIARRERSQQRVLGRIAPHSPKSNFLAVSAAESQTGNPLLYGAPQVGYDVPSFFWELDLHSPTLDVRGPAVPGVSLFPALGRSIDHAWSLTTGFSDGVDLRVEKLCDPNGKKVKANAKHYTFKGKCKKMTSRVETISSRASGGSTEDTKLTIYRTVHGPVFERSTVKGKPVALVRERSFWMNEWAAAVALSRLGASATDSIEEVQASLAEASMSFNVIYADHEHIAAFHVGRYPLRAKGVDPKLPVWGTGKWEWKGTVPFEDLPKVIDPAQGWLANWNGKPSTGWNNGDESFWGAGQRGHLLTSKMEALVEGGKKATLSDLVDVARIAATQDGNGVYLGDEFLSFTEGVTGAGADARTAYQAWVAGGAHRVDLNRDGLTDFGPAIALHDLWYELTIKAVFDDELDGNYTFIQLPRLTRPGTQGGGYYSGLFTPLYHSITPGGPEAARDYCDNIDTDATETCAQTIRGTFDAAVTQLVAAQGADVSKWTKAADMIIFEASGADRPPASRGRTAALGTTPWR